MIDITEGSNYPIGLLGGDIELHFLHYKTFEEANNKWYERIGRMDMDNLYLIFVQQEGCSDQYLEQFASLKSPNKIAFVNYSENLRENEYYITGFDRLKTLGIISTFKGWSGTRYYDEFDWSIFLSLNYK